MLDDKQISRKAKTPPLNYCSESKKKMVGMLLDRPLSEVTLRSLRVLMTGASVESVAACRVAPLLLGMTRSFLGDVDLDRSEARLRRLFLAPTERFKVDAEVWAPHRFVKSFLRKWFLDRRYCGTERYKSAIGRLRTNDSLVSRRELDEIFGLDTWERCAESPDVEDRRKLELLEQLEVNDDTRDLSFEEVMEAGGACVYGRNEFNAYCEQFGIYDFFTKDYIEALADELRDFKGTTILEVGAGNGALSRHLGQTLNTKIHATDSGDWRILGNGVETLDVDAALAKYQPALVVCAWMPSGVDFTKAIRATPSVRAYALIGEADDGACCGHPYDTWGLGGTAPYEKDGFHRVDLPSVSNHQISRYDSMQFVGNSKTVLFCRNNRKKRTRLDHKNSFS